MKYKFKTQGKADQNNVMKENTTIIKIQHNNQQKSTQMEIPNERKQFVIRNNHYKHKALKKDSAINNDKYLN